MTNLTSKTETTKEIEFVIASNLGRMQTEYQRLLCRLRRARAVKRNLKIETEFSFTMDEHEERMVDQYEAFIADLEVYIEHYEYEIAKVRTGLEEARVLSESKAKRIFLNYIADDTNRTIANLRVANSEYKEILAILPAEGYDPQ